MVPAVKDAAPIAGGSLASGQAGDLAGSTGWSLVLVGEASEATGESDTIGKGSVSEGVQKEGLEEGACSNLSTLKSKQLAARESGQVATREWFEYGGGSEISTAGGQSTQDAGLNASSSVIGARGTVWEGALEELSGGSSICQSAATGCRTLGRSVKYETVRLDSPACAHTGEKPGAKSQGLAVDFFSKTAQSQIGAPAVEGIPLPVVAPETLPTGLPPHKVECASSTKAPNTPVVTAGDVPVQSLGKESQKVGQGSIEGATESQAAMVEAPPTEGGSLQRRVSAPIQIQQGRPGRHAFAASAPADRARPPVR